MVAPFGLGDSRLLAIPPLYPPRRGGVRVGSVVDKWLERGSFRQGRRSCVRGTESGVMALIICVPASLAPIPIRSGAHLITRRRRVSCSTVAAFADARLAQVIWSHVLANRSFKPVVHGLNPLP